MSMKTFFLGVVLVAFVSQALGHSYLTKPTSRSNQKETTTGCRGPNCLGPCDRSRSAATRAPVVAARGSSISVEWPRNNHAGGFIRLAWAQTSQSDSHTAFDNGVQQINCHEVGGCKPDNDQNNKNGGDSAPPDGSSQPCKTTIQIPNHLTDGAWTLQWAWYGGAFELGDYYSCVDYTISGGALSAVSSAPVFKGGDYTYPGQQKCKYFNTDRLHKCVNEPCDNPVYARAVERSGAPFMSGVTAAPAPATQAPAPTVQASQAPYQPPVQISQAPATQSPSGGSACKIGNMRCASDTTYETCSPTRTSSAWVGPQSCAAGLHCNPNGDHIYCGYTPAAPTQQPEEEDPVEEQPQPTPNPPSSSSCTLGHSQCSGTSGYKTCGNGNNGPAWYAVQQCQAGQSCHQSGTTIYCY